MVEILIKQGANDVFGSEQVKIWIERVISVDDDDDDLGTITTTTIMMMIIIIL